MRINTVHALSLVSHDLFLEMEVWNILIKIAAECLVIEKKIIN